MSRTSNFFRSYYVTGHETWTFYVFLFKPWYVRDTDQLPSIIMLDPSFPTKIQKYKAYHLAPILVILLTVCLCPLSAAEALLEVLPLEHTSSDELIPIIESLVQLDVVITGRGQQLIVRATPSQLETIKTLITKLDIPQRRLLISVRQIEHTHRREDSFNKSIDTYIGSLADPPHDKTKLKARQYFTKKQHNGVYRVHALEGNEAFISFDQLIPYEDQQYFSVGRQNRFGRTRKYNMVSNGFLILPRLKGDLVELKITSRQQRPQKDQDDILKRTHIKTFIRGHVGQWMDLGTISDREIDDGERQMISRKIHTVQREFIIQVKVELKH